MARRAQPGGGLSGLRPRHSDGSGAIASSSDLSNGYDALVETFRAARSDAGADVVAEWIKPLAPGTALLDLGAGTGDPILPVLLAAELDVFAVDASPSMVAALTAKYPSVTAVCEAVEDSSFFDRRFEAVLAIGLIFLLSEQVQIDLIHRLANVVAPKGQLLLSAPLQTGGWDDVLTKQPSRSLGEAAYHAHLEAAGFEAIQHLSDAGGSNYYAARRAG